MELLPWKRRHFEILFWESSNFSGSIFFVCSFFGGVFFFKMPSASFREGEVTTPKKEASNTSLAEKVLANAKEAEKKQTEKKTEKKAGW